MLRFGSGILALVVALGLIVCEKRLFAAPRPEDTVNNPTIQAGWCVYGTYPLYRDAYNAANHLADCGFTTDIRYAYAYYIVYYWR